MTTGFTGRRAGSLGELGPGSRVAGYLIEEQIGAGGMAVVFRARDEVFRRPAAVKVILPSMAGDEQFRARFLRESQAVATVDSPHIIPVYKTGEDGGLLYIATRLVTGGDLAALLRRSGGALTADRVSSLITQVASALDAAHAAGLVHRDVKPGNVLVDIFPGGADHAYLSDFGLSKATEAATRLTAAGQFVGTPDYSAPEQIKSAYVDGRTDQYALACMAFVLLTGRLPFHRDGALATLFAHLQDPVPRVTDFRPDLPVAVNGAIARALAKTPARRYGQCGEFAAALRQALDPAAPAAVPGGRQFWPAGDSPAAGHPGTQGAGRPATASARSFAPAAARVPAAPSASFQPSAVSFQPSVASFQPSMAPRTVAPRTVDPVPPRGAQRAGRPAAGRPPGGGPAGPGHRGNGKPGRRGLVFAGGGALLAAVAAVVALSLTGGGATPASAAGTTTGQRAAGPGAPTPKEAAAHQAGQPGQPQPTGSVPTIGGSPQTPSGDSPTGSKHMLNPPPDNQATTLGSVGPPPPVPVVTAVASGTSITYTWNAQSNGLADTLQLCIAGTCTTSSVPATGVISSVTHTYGSSQTETITATVTDAEKRSSSATPASATTAAASTSTATVPAVTLAEGPNAPGGRDLQVSASGFTADASLSYTCTASSGVFYTGTSTLIGASYASTETLTTDATGSLSFATACYHLPDGSTVTLTVTVGTQTKAAQEVMLNPVS
jgi:Protein kinase domain